MSVAEFLSTNLIYLLFCTLTIGLIVGSFLNVVIYRLPIMMEREWTDQCSELLEIENSKKPLHEIERFNLAKPDSHCPKCNHAITAVENIPLFSFIFQGGKCSQCKTPISIRYPLIEAISGLLSCLVAYHYGFSWLSLALLFFTWSLIVLTMIDFDHQLLPDDITLPMLWLGLIINSFGLITSLQNALWGAVGGYMILWSVFWLFKLATGKDGLGYGDFKLLAALGAWMGWQSLPIIILLSSLVGALIGIILMMTQGRDKNTPFSFGPYLASAGFIALIWGEQINTFYYNLL
jgi:leader peptidase (prepilin peptidase) / N-methyltransferase